MVMLLVMLMNVKIHLSVLHIQKPVDVSVCVVHVSFQKHLGNIDICTCLGFWARF